MRTIDSILTEGPVIPVLVIDELDHAQEIAEALVDGGLRVIEVTLRTPAALRVIGAMKRVPEAIVGAGTVLNADQYRQAREAGADFLVSPGLTAELASTASADGAPYLPGIATASDIMRALEFGFTRLKFFPATAAGGPAALKSLSPVFADVRFCPTGGIREDTAADWLQIPSVDCVGGSWIVPPGVPFDPDAIRRRARAAAQLRQPLNPMAEQSA